VYIPDVVMVGDPVVEVTSAEVKVETPDKLPTDLGLETERKPKPADVFNPIR
jgi:hypothetical protein